MRLRLLSLASFVLLAALVGGCGRSKAVKVSGIVTLDDVPVEGATVQFVPVDSSKGATAICSSTGSDGRYRLTTKNPNDGAVPGEYKVLVTLSDIVDAPPGAGTGPGGGMRPDQMIDPMKGFAEEQRKQTKGGKEGPKKKATKIPAVYGDFKTTPLKATVPADGDINLPLWSKGG
jgi:hypothetical protein